MYQWERLHLVTCPVKMQKRANQVDLVANLIICVLEEPPKWCPYVIEHFLEIQLAAGEDESQSLKERLTK